MRDPKRIEPALRALAMYWHAHPDLRLGQIVDNASQFAGVSDIFNMEDDRLVAGIQWLWTFDGD